MTIARRLIPSGNPLEAQAGYSRAVVQEPWCFVAGTTGRDPLTGIVPDAVGDQAQVALGIIAQALAAGGFAPIDIVRATCYVTDASFCDAIYPVLGRFFGEIRPAATLVVVAGLVAPELKIEIEVTAYKG